MEKVRPWEGKGLVHQPCGEWELYLEPRIASSLLWFLSLILKHSVFQNRKGNVKGIEEMHFRCRVKFLRSEGVIVRQMVQRVLGRRKNRFFPWEDFGCWSQGRKYTRSFSTLRMHPQAFSWFSLNPWLAGFTKNVVMLFFVYFFGGNIFKWLKHQKTEDDIQLTLERQGSELCRSTCRRVFLGKYHNGFCLSYGFLNNIFFSLTLL